MIRHVVSTMALAMAIVAPPLGAQATQEAIDFTKAVVAEVRNAQGQVVLTGKFAVVEEDDDDIERKATLTATAIDKDAFGEAEVEVDRGANPRRQEVEFSIANVQPGAVFTLMIDGKVFAKVTADSQGRAAHDRDVPLPVRNTSP